MRTYNTNPFQATPHTVFPLDRFLLLVQTEPLEAKAVLAAALASGSISFPRGTSEHSLYQWIVNDLLRGKERDEGEDTPLLRQRYQPLTSLASEQQQCSGFPYAFVQQLLERLAQGEHPLFLRSATALLGELFAGNEETPPDKQTICFEMA